ncbi:MAG TPA: M36 family metallopeptidase [Actinomycetota bacterium]|nr:M36 family metallopeptidase [Actinomycetota bacterium]
MLARFHRGSRRGGVALLAVALTVPMAIASGLPAGASSKPPAREFSFQGEGARAGGADARAGRVSPSAAQRRLAAGARVSWNAFGTPLSIFKQKGWLATGLSGNDGVAARTWLKRNHALFRLDAADVDRLDVIMNVRVGSGSAVTFRQRFGDAVAAADGLVTVGVSGGRIAYASSSIAGDGAAPGGARIPAEQAWDRAASDAGRTGAKASVNGAVKGWTLMSAAGFEGRQAARLRALPTPRNGVRPVWETIVFDNATGGDPLALLSWVDAQTGKVWRRESLVNYAEDNPAWKAFPASPPQDYSSSDTRELWCWTKPSPGCDRALDPSSPDLEWDVNPGTGPSFTTDGNNAKAVHNWNSNDPFTVGTETATPRPDRDYVYPWTNQWFEQRCNPDTTFTSAQRNDIDAARANLFAMHNRMHDWSYHLGFTEQTFNLQKDNFGRGGLGNDHEQGNAQAGGISGGPPNFEARDNANQITPPDGMAPITNMYLWQPIAGAFYAPCVDGDYDQTVIGHEYTHAITNRMVGGPDLGLSGPQAGAMGESWSDLNAMEYLNEYGFVPVGGENRYAVGPYVTGDKQAGIRNYGMNRSPLNYSDIGYDVTGPQVHADGEIWSATNFAIRQALIAKYDRQFPSGNRGLQQACADGKRPADRCPGNRRWAQLMYDSYLLQPSQTSMVTARDALLAADLVRFGGANQAVLWNTFASRGLGEDAFSNTNADPDPIPSFASPFANEGLVSLQPKDDKGNPVAGAQLFVGRYEARAMPVADTNGATALPGVARMVPGTYDFIVRADGFGAKRFRATVRANKVTTPKLVLPANLASRTNGATISGDGVNLTSLIDDTEATNWASLGVAVQGRAVTVHLDPAKPSHKVRRVQVSAHLRPPFTQNDPNDPAQSRFSALRQFQIQVCTVSTGVDCTQDSQFKVAFTSKADAFPAIRPRPRAPELIIRSFDLHSVQATYVRLVVLNNQCTGTPGYQGEQDADPRAVDDCDLGSPQGLNVRAAELQVFAR